MTVHVTARLMLTVEREEYVLPEGADAAAAVELLRGKHPELGEMDALLISRNGKRAGRSEPLSDGDALELILLMGGG